MAYIAQVSTSTIFGQIHTRLQMCCVHSHTSITIYCHHSSNAIFGTHRVITYFQQCKCVFICWSQCILSSTIVVLRRSSACIAYSSHRQCQRNYYDSSSACQKCACPTWQKWKKMPKCTRKMPKNANFGQNRVIT